MAEHKEITTLEEWDAIDLDECVAGYREARIGDPEPGDNHTRSYWHGWKMRMNDLGVIPATEGHGRLLRAVLKRGDLKDRIIGHYA